MEFNRKPGVSISLFSLVMINIIAVDNLRSLPIAASYGFSLVFFYTVVSLAFFIPTALVSAELATAWPNTGGLYVWVKQAFGKRFGFLAIWLLWIYNVVWYPTILAFIATAIAYLFSPELAKNTHYMFYSVLSIFWLTTGLNCFGLRASSLISAIGALLGTIVPMVFICILGVVWVLKGHPVQIEWTRASFFKDVSHFDNLSYLVAITFGLMGLEMSAIHAGEVKNPQRNYPRALLISVLFIYLTLVLASLSIAVVLPHDEIHIISGLIDAFNAFFHAFDLPKLIPLMVIAIIIGGLGGVSTWIYGPTKGLMIACQDGNLPPLLGKTNRFGAPFVILLLQGAIFTLLCTSFRILPSIKIAYWFLSALTGQLALLVYILLFAAAITLRYRHPDVSRAYRIPFGNLGMWLTSGIGILTCLACIGVGFVPPAQIPVGNVMLFEGMLASGILLFCLPAFWLYQGD